MKEKNLDVQWVVWYILSWNTQSWENKGFYLSGIHNFHALSHYALCFSLHRYVLWCRNGKLRGKKKIHTVTSPVFIAVELNNAMPFLVTFYLTCAFSTMARLKGFGNLLYSSLRIPLIGKRQKTCFVSSMLYTSDIFRLICT